MRRQKPTLQKRSFVRNKIVYFQKTNPSVKAAFLQIFCRLPRNCEHHLPLQASNFRRSGKRVFLKADGSKAENMGKQNPLCCHERPINFFSPARAFGGVRGESQLPAFLVLLATKSTGKPRLRGILS